MDFLNRLQAEKKRFAYLGKGSEYALIFFKNFALTIITLGFYYPWAKVERLKYLYQSTELEASKFTFHGTGKEVFKGFIKVYIPLIVIYIFLIYSSLSNDLTLLSATIGVFYLFAILLVPFAIHGAMRYRSARSSWKGIFFKYLGDKMELFWKCLIGSLLTILTLGIYSSWFAVDIRKYILSHLRFGNLSFDFKGEGSTLFWINVKFFFLFFLTLGVYSIWYFKELWAYYADNTEITQNGRVVKFSLEMKPGDVFELIIVNFLLIVFTLGIATPWVIIRTNKFMFRFLRIEEGLHTNSIKQIQYSDYTSTTGESFLDFLDVDLL